MLNISFFKRKDMFEYTIDQVKKYMLENKNYISKYSVVILTQGTISDLKISPYTDVMGITKTRYYQQNKILQEDLDNYFSISPYYFKFINNKIIQNATKLNRGYVYLITEPTNHVIEYKKLAMKTAEIRRKKEEYKKSCIERMKIVNARLKNVNNEIITQYVIYNDKKCNCCFMDYKKEHLIYCDKLSMCRKHIICYNCLERNIDIQIQNSNCDSMCIFNPTDKCDGKYKLEKIKDIIGDQKYKTYNILYDIKTTSLNALIIDDYQICPHCRRYGVEVNNKNSIDYINCVKCNKQWCNLCRKPSHEGFDCYSIDFSSVNSLKQDNQFIENEKNIIIDNILQEIYAKITINKCPHCSTEYIKTEGCNLITCSKCNRYSCYCCRIKIFPKKIRAGNIVSKYYHFTGNDYNTYNTVNYTCPLYYNNGNIDANIRKKSFIIELNKLFTINTDIKQHIFERVKILLGFTVYKSLINDIDDKFNITKSLVVIIPTAPPLDIIEVKKNYCCCIM